MCSSLPPMHSLSLSHIHVRISIANLLDIWKMVSRAEIGFCGREIIEMFRVTFLIWRKLSAIGKNKENQNRMISDTRETNRFSTRLCWIVSSATRYSKFSCNLWWNYAENAIKFHRQYFTIGIYFDFPSLDAIRSSISIYQQSPSRVAFNIQSPVPNGRPQCAPKKNEWIQQRARIFPVINFTRIIYLKYHFACPRREHLHSLLERKWSVFHLHDTLRQHLARNPVW